MSNIVIVEAEVDRCAGCPGLGAALSRLIKAHLTQTPAAPPPPRRETPRVAAGSGHFDDPAPAAWDAESSIQQIRLRQGASLYLRSTNEVRVIALRLVDHHDGDPFRRRLLARAFAEAVRRDARDFWIRDRLREAAAATWTAVDAVNRFQDLTWHPLAPLLSSLVDPDGIGYTLPTETHLRAVYVWALLNRGPRGHGGALGGRNVLSAINSPQIYIDWAIARFIDEVDGGRRECEPGSHGDIDGWLQCQVLPGCWEWMRERWCPRHIFQGTFLGDLLRRVHDRRVPLTAGLAKLQLVEAAAGRRLSDRNRAGFFRGSLAG